MLIFQRWHVGFENGMKMTPIFTIIFNRVWYISTTPNTTKIFDHFQNYTAIYDGHSELFREEKSKFEFEEKKFRLLLKVAFSRQKCLQTFLFSNKLNFFSSNSNFEFSSRDDSECP